MDRFNVAVKVVQNAGNLLRQCRLEEAEVSQKTGHQDLVTRWDRRIEQLLRNEILTAFPQDAIVGEEYPPETHRAESVTWYIDPIDGTTNFINQHQNYAISVGCWEGSVPLFGLVLDVERKALYWGKPVSYTHLIRPTKATGFGVRLEAERKANGTEMMAPTMVPRNAMQMVSNNK